MVACKPRSRNIGEPVEVLRLELEDQTPAGGQYCTCCLRHVEPNDLVSWYYFGVCSDCILERDVIL